jgi:ABC-type nitrate/sulfonate/bicarbonate transport system substrate-binding protein
VHFSVVSISAGNVRSLFALRYKANPKEGAMMKRLLAAVVTTAFALAAIPDTTRAEDTKLVVIVFPGVPNLPIFAAQAKGFFAKRGLDIDVRFTPNSEELRNGLAEGRYQIAHAAIDNAFAMKDKANVDIAVVSGGDNSFNHLIVQPEIMSLADIKGKTVVVDAVNTAYAFQLYEMLRQNGLKQGDYQVNPVGGTTLRLEAMIKDKAMVAAMMYPPFSVRAQKAGLRSMGTAAAALGAYQGTSAFVLRKWGQANADTLVRYLQAYIEGVRWSLDIANKPEAVALMIERLKLSDDVAAQAYDVATNPKEGFDRDAALNLEGVKNVLRLRAQFEGGTPASTDMYIELSYYQKAMAGL